MKYQSHVLIAATSITFAEPWSQGLTTAIAAYFLVMLGGLLPDIDHPKSFIGSRIPLIPEILFKLDGHRGFTHGLPMLALVWILGVLLVAHFDQPMDGVLAHALGIGYLTHLAGDFVTNNGIPLFKPFSSKRYVISLAKTGRLSEPILVGAFLFLAIGVVA